MSQLAILIGVIMCFVAFGTDTAPAGTHNLGLLQHQMMLLHTGLALTLAGVIRIPRTEDRAYAPREAVELTEDEIAAERKRKTILGVVLIAAFAALVFLVTR